MASRESKKHESDSLMDRSRKDEHVLEEDEPIMLESSDSDPEFPADSEYEVDEGGFKGSKSKHPGLLWAILAIVAVIVLCLAFFAIGDWFTPNEAAQIAQEQFDEATVPEDMGS